MPISGCCCSRGQCASRTSFGGPCGRCAEAARIDSQCDDMIAVQQDLEMILTIVEMVLPPQRQQ